MDSIEISVGVIFSSGMGVAPIRDEKNGLRGYNGDDKNYPIMTK